MSNTAITYLVGACAAVFGFAAYVVYVAVPAWSAYSRAWERVAGVFLSLYVLVAFVGFGVAAGLGVIYFYDRFV